MFIDVFGHKFYLWSFICITSTWLICFYRLKGIKFIHRFLISTNLCIFASHFGEIIYTLLLTGIVPHVYVLSTLGLLLLLILCNVYYKFLHFNRLFLVLVVIQIFVYATLIFSGHYIALNLWNAGKGPDPHGWLWVINNGIAFWMWLPLVWKVNKHKK